MNSKRIFDIIAGIVFLIVAVVHLVRAIYGWEVLVAGMIVPVWISYVGVVAAGLLSYFGLRKS